MRGSGFAGIVAGLALTLSMFAGGCPPPNGTVVRVGEKKPRPPSARWTTFMGNPARTGALAGTPITRPRLRWRRWIGIPGYLNNPVVVGDLVVVGSSGFRWNRPDPRDGVYAFAARSGRPRWRVRTRGDVNGVSVAGGRVYAATDHGSVLCLDARTGRRRWVHRMRGAVRGSPLVLGNTVYLGDARGWLAALDAGTGQVRWRRRFAAGFRAPLSSDGRRLFAGTVAGEVIALDPATGAPAWRFRLSSVDAGLARQPLYPAPVVAEGKVFIGYARDSYYENPPLLALDAGTGRLLWRAEWTDRPEDEHAGNLRATPAYADGTLYFALPYSNRAFAVDAATGRVAWALPVGGCYFSHWSSATVGGGLIYQPKTGGRLYALDPSGNVQWVFRVSPLPRRLPWSAASPQRSCRWRPGRGWNRIYASAAYHPAGILFIADGSGSLSAIGQ